MGHGGLVIVLLSFFAISWAQFLPLDVTDEEHAASLGGAEVGLYRRSSDGFLPIYYPGYFPFIYPFNRRSEINSASLGGARVGFYGRD
ncbi:hypothetical protein HNY73_002799 [Argiope bruennichi]|uniref:Secreted protein n=1 Tax=Argiope bruennichi TaxID=94029 RepID=A0A8T0G139_ARGBR|nr:hypothetical protein HNY73_002799 [Argiope bruennichi]